MRLIHERVVELRVAERGPVRNRAAEYCTREVDGTEVGFPHVSGTRFLGGTFYPFVRMPLEPDVTAIVGANESGKSQFLAAIRSALSGEGIERRDFCRYSSFFSDSRLTVPEFGVRFSGLGEREREIAAEMCRVEVPDDVATAALFS